MNSNADRRAYAEQVIRAPLSGSGSPSAWPRRVIVIVLAIIDMVLAGYLALYQWRWIDTVWDPFFGVGSELVLDSVVSESFRRLFLVPDAAVGAAGYLAEAVLGLIGKTDRWWRHPWLVVAFGAVAAAMALVGLLLVVLQGAVVGAWCFICLVTAALSVIMAWVVYPEARASLRILFGARGTGDRAS